MSGCGYCLLCSSPHIISHNFQNEYPPEETSSTPSIVDVGAKVIFLLRQLLHLPESQCEEHLVNHGHPATWINLCDPCSVMVQRGVDLWAEMGRLEAELQSLGATLRNQMDVKSEVLGNDGDSFDEGEGSQIVGQDGLGSGGGSAADKIRAFLLSASPVNHFNDETSEYPLQLETVSDMDVYDMMGEEILPEPPNHRHPSQEEEEEHQIEIQVPHPLDETGFDSNDNDPIGSPSRNSSSSESDLDLSDSDDCCAICAINDKPCKYRNGKESSDDEYEPNPRRGQRSLLSKKKKSNNLSKNRKAKRTEEKADEQNYDNIPVQSSWVWSDFVEWRKSRLLEFQQMVHPIEGLKAKSDPVAVPSLEWLAHKFKIYVFPCPVCKKTFPSLQLLTRHRPTHRPRTSGARPLQHKCWFDGCAGSFGYNRHTLEGHFRAQHLSRKELSCTGCGQCFAQIKDFNMHVKECKEQEEETNQTRICKENALICSKCTEIGQTNYFVSQLVLDVHNRAKHRPVETYPFPCTVPGCGKLFTNCYALTSHTKNMHNPDPQNWICDQCGAIFKQQYLMVSHIKGVHQSRQPGAKRFPCDICGREMISQSKLTRHKQIHIRPEDAPHLCTLCGKRFRLREYLNIHMRSHDPDRRSKYTHYQPKKKKAPEEPEKTGVAGAKIGRPPVKKQPDYSVDKSKVPAKPGRKKKQQDTSPEDTTSSASNSMEYTENSGPVNSTSVTTQPEFSFNNSVSDPSLF